MNIIVEPVKNDEIQLLADFSRKTFYDTFHQHNSKENMEMFLEKSLHINVLQHEMSQSANTFFFAKAGNEIAGFLKLSTAAPPEELINKETLEVARIYAAQQFIGAGVGKALMEFAVSFARQLNKEMIWLGVWEHNLKAINFYQRFGFEKFGEHVFMVGNDPQTDWLMKKGLVK